MINSSLEIKDNEYLIKFSKQQFDLDFVKSLLTFINQKLSVKEASETLAFEDVHDRHSSEENYFSHLDEK